MKNLLASFKDKILGFRFKISFPLWFLMTGLQLNSAGANVSITFPQTSNEDNSVAVKLPQELVLSSEEHLGAPAAHVANLGLRTLRDLLDGHSNVIISPLNVYSCLGILKAGAEGVTKEEIRRVLGPDSGNRAGRDVVKSHDGVSFASALFLDLGFSPKPEFAEVASTEFLASVINVNVSDGEQAKTTINSWVSEHTNGTIENLLQGRLEPYTKMVIVSALLFKGKWLHAFPTSTTAPGTFETETSSVEVPFMHLLASVPLVRNSQFDAISLPYVDSHGMTMHVILPKARGAHAIKKLLSRLSPDSLKKLRKESSTEEMFITLPRMTVGGRFSLTDSLKKQGISSMFDSSKANFSALIEESTGLYVSQVYHSVYFEMNEEGTEASAATASILTKSSKFIFRANRPFIFAITDISDFILFIGVIVNPVP